MYEILRVVVAQGHKRVTAKWTGCRFDSHSRKILLLNTQWFQITAESGERSDLTLGSYYLPCYRQDTALSWKRNVRNNSRKSKCSKDIITHRQYFRRVAPSVKEGLWQITSLSMKRLVDYGPSISTFIFPNEPRQTRIYLLILLVFILYLYNFKKRQREPSDKALTSSLKN